MIIFHNPGLIPLEAIRLMGASVKTAGAFGRFGTGFKYAVATILRGGGSVVVWRGEEKLTFWSEPVKMRGETFDEVMLKSDGHSNRTRLGFTTALGKDWEPWMALRELACNARDEGGDFQFIKDQPVPTCFSAKDGETAIIVEWPELDAELEENEHAVFAPDLPPLGEEHGVRVLPGPSPYLYHRGVRVWKLPKPSVFTYDIVKPVDLTEDRTVKYAFVVTADVRNMMLRSESEEVIAATVTAKKGTWEAGFDWKGEEWAQTQPNATWLNVVARLREANGYDTDLSSSARDVLIKHQAFREVSRAIYQGPEGAHEGLSDAAELVQELMGEGQVDPDIYIATELPGDWS